MPFHLHTLTEVTFICLSTYTLTEAPLYLFSNKLKFKQVLLLVTI